MVTLPLEHEEQAAFFVMAAYHENQYPELRWLHANVNGAALMRKDPSQKFSRQAEKLKAEGLRKGILDVSLEVARGGYFGFWLEMKRKGNNLTPEQREFTAFLHEQGYYVGLAYTAEEAWDFLECYLRMPKTQVVGK